MAQRIKETTDNFVRDFRQVSERWWGATQRTIGVAGSQATLLRKKAQTKLDLGAVVRKMSARYSELGREIFRAREQGDADPLGREEVVRLLSELDALREREDTLNHELARSMGHPGAETTDTTEEDLHP